MGCNSSSFSSTKNVVIVGGGYAGLSAAKLLDPHFNVTWIEKRPNLVHKIGIRQVVRPSWIQPMQIPLGKVLKRGKLIRASVTGIDFQSRTVTLDKGDPVAYDYLVIASGATSHAPVEPRGGKDPKEYFEGTSSTIAGAKNIVIAGGGPVACELAGEIKAKHPNTTVTIVSRSKILCAAHGLTEANSSKVAALLNKVGITTLTGESVKLEGDANNEDSFIIGSRTVTLTSGSTIPNVDLIINCTGSTPNTEFMPPSMVNEKKEIKVNDYLQISGHPECFAVGDCNDVKSIKLMALSGTKKGRFGFPPGQVDTLYANLSTIETAKEGEKPVLKAYKAPAPTKGGMVLIPAGPKHSIAIGAPGMFASMKAKHFFYPMQWDYVHAGKDKPPMPKD